MSRPSPDRPAVVVVGSLHFDVIVRAPRLPRMGETLIGEAWWWKPGGKGGNQAMAAARHGATVEMVGCLGDDDLGARLRERLAQARVGLRNVRTVARGSGMSVAIERADGEYAAVIVSGANREVDEQQVRASAGPIEASRVLVLQNELDEEVDLAAARLARSTGVSVVLNAAPARPMDGLSGQVDIVVVNAIEAQMLGADLVDDLTSAAEAARTLRSLAPVVVVTAGAAGVAAAVGETTLTYPAHPVASVATHGAGDVFVGALAARLAHADALEAALAYANAAAALHVGTPGPARDTLGPTDVWHRLEREPDADLGHGAR